MAFKKTTPAPKVPDSPDKILAQLPKKKIKGVLHHQGAMMQAYAKAAVEASDVALQLPTGSGKTLVGLLIAEWRRMKFQERVVYLCPTKQLVHQAVEQAQTQYGLNVNGFTGRSKDYVATAKAEYMNGSKIAITNYSSLFNRNPFFDSPHTIILDDAHAAENYVASYWNFRVEAERPEHAELHAAIARVLKPHISSRDYDRLMGNWFGLADRVWVDKIPGPLFYDIQDELRGVIDEFVRDLDAGYAWENVRDNLSGCQMYLSTHDIVIRPIIPPTWTYKPFANAKQRIFMSATLGNGGDLERLTGCKKILRLPIQEEWNRQGFGRRYFVFPGMSLKESHAKKLVGALIEKAERSLVLVPNGTAAEQMKEFVEASVGFKTFNAADIEESKKDFLREKKAVAIVANRYDGIDFPGDDCRLLVVNGLPKAATAQERFFMAKMGATVLLNERIQTRILQAIGRCTRSQDDYSAVVVLGDELEAYLANSDRIAYLHPELQAEIRFGLDQSLSVSADDLLDNFRILLENDDEWEEANSEILALRDTVTQVPFPGEGELSAVVRHEIEYQARLWQGHFEEAYEAAEKVLAKLTIPELRGYRALWHYLAGNAAWFAWRGGGAPALEAKARGQYSKAKEAAPNIAWLVKLAAFQMPAKKDETRDALTQVQVENIEAALVKLGTVNDKKFSKLEKEIVDGLHSKEASAFENAQKMLGDLLGFNAQKVESDGSPDPWWALDKFCIVFEDYSGAEQDTLYTDKARQAAGHPDWIVENGNLPKGTDIVSVLVGPITKASEGAAPHLTYFSFWSLHDYQKWGKNALQIIRELRRTLHEEGDLIWRAAAMKIIEENNLDMVSLFKRFKSSPAQGHLEIKKGKEKA